MRVGRHPGATEALEVIEVIDLVDDVPVTDLPNLLGRVVAVYTEDFTFLDDEYIAEVRINGSSGDGCVAGAIGTIQTIDAKPQ